MAEIEAAVIDKFANIGVITSTNARPWSGLAFLGTIIVDPGSMSSFLKKWKLPDCLTDLPLGKIK